MAIAPDAILFKIVDRIIPKVDGESSTQEVIFGIRKEFVTMMFLDIAVK